MAYRLAVATHDGVHIDRHFGHSEAFVIYAVGADGRIRCYLLRDEVAEVENETFSWLCKGLSPEQIEALLSATDVMLQNARQDCKKGRDCGCD